MAHGKVQINACNYSNGLLRRVGFCLEETQVLGESVGETLCLRGKSGWHFTPTFQLGVFYLGQCNYRGPGEHSIVFTWRHRTF
jgi:hypothetical protein